MSSSNLLTENNLDLYCRSISVEVPGSGIAKIAGATFYLNAATQAIPNGTETVVLYDTVISSGGNFSDLPVSYVPGTGIFTALNNCTMNAVFQVLFATPGGATPYAMFLKKGSVNSGYANFLSTSVPNGIFSSSWTTTLNEGDTFRIYVSQTSGGPLNITGLGTSTSNYTKIGLTFTYTD